MTGIYKITNLVTGQSYIGQSVNIERRFMEHRTPKANKYQVDKDITKLGKDNFRFDVLEECPKEKLIERERHYIETLNPEYNQVVKGRGRDDRFKAAVKEGTKTWWFNLPEKTKRKIISNNLTGPKKGHIVSEATREKLRQASHEIHKKKAKIVETGQIFDSIGELEKSLGACTGTYAAYRSGKIKTVKGYHVVEV